MARVLLVDDYEPSLRTLSQVFQRLGHEVEARCDLAPDQTAEGYALLALDWVGVLVVANFARAAKATRPDLPILVLTGMPEVRASALAAGADRVLLKPVPMAELAPVLRELLGEEPPL